MKNTVIVRPRRLFVVIAIFVLLVGSARAACQSGCQPTQKPNWDVGATYSVSIASSMPSASQSAILDALDYWNGYFTSYGMSARFTYTSVGPGQITITIDPSLQTTGTGAIYDHPATGGTGSIALNPDYINDTALLKTIMEHEYGHGLGFDDVGTASCNGLTAMYTNTQGGGTSSALSGLTDCDKAGATTAYPPPAPTDPPDIQDTCNPQCSPIVINFTAGSYLLTGSESPVLFDIADTGRALQIGWTAGGADEAFLSLDHDQFAAFKAGLKNGLRAANGFSALAELDDNHDGLIDEHDAIWQRLLLWRDLNHDGVSQHWEIVPVTESTLAAISVQYHWTGRRDSSGNTFRYESKVWIRNASDRRVPRAVYDIFFSPVR